MHYYRARRGQPLEAPGRGEWKQTDGSCSEAGCSGKVRARGLCSAHYEKYRIKARALPCSVPGCDRSSVDLEHALCNAHNIRRRTGRPMDAPIERGTQRLCIVPGCGRVHFGRYFCQTHRRRALERPQILAQPIRVTAPPGSGTIREGYRAVRVGGSYVFEHRVIMERCLGRKLLPTENVHHKNGDRLDNRLVKGHELFCPGGCCNLELWAKVQPAGQRVADQVAWARTILRRYRRQSKTVPTQLPLL